MAIIDLYNELVTKNENEVNNTSIENKEETAVMHETKNEMDTTFMVQTVVATNNKDEAALNNTMNTIGEVIVDQKEADANDVASNNETEAVTEDTAVKNSSVEAEATLSYQELHEAVTDNVMSNDGVNTDIDTNDTENKEEEKANLPNIKGLKFEPRVINDSSKNYTVEAVYNNIKNQKFRFDNAVQRSNVWTVEQQSLLIDSFIRKMPVPPLYSREVEGGNYDFLDGKQRCEAIRAFMDDEFALKGVPEIESADTDETLDINGYKYSELPKGIMDAIRGTTLLIYTYKNNNGTPLDDDQTADIFFRMNNGTALKKIEKMRVKVKSYDKVQKLAAHPIFDDMLNEKAKNGYTHEDLSIKALRLSKYGDNNLSLLSKDIAPYIEETTITDDAVNHVSDVFTMLKDTRDYLKEKADATKDDGVKKSMAAVAKRIYVKIHMLSLTKLTERALEEKISKEDYANFLLKFYNNGERGKTSCSNDYNNACHSGSNSAANVSKRLEALTKEYESFFKA